MDYAAALPLLDHLRQLVDEHLTNSPHLDAGARYQEICETYGAIADVYSAVVGGNLKVQVPPGGRAASLFPNYFEAGYMSGRSFHRAEGRAELLKVIGAVRARAAAKATAAAPKSVTTVSFGSRVFIVHGHDRAALQTVARFIERLDLPITILHEQPNRGRTLIEKFEQHSDAGFAVVLTTGDDRGGPADAPPDTLRPCARQNVIFELGFFIGKLGRQRVCALYEEGVELPSDYAGVAFVPLDTAQAWRLELAREMHAAGLPVDLNKTI